MRMLLILLTSILRSVHALFRSREEPAIVELALRQQLAVYAQNRSRPRLSPLDRTFWVVLSRIWPRWKDHLVLVRPETVVRWHRQGFRRYWRSISTPGPGRPPISEGTRALIGSVRRELLDHVVVMTEDHLRRLLREYTEYYNNERIHTSIGDAPNGRAIESRPSGRAKIIGFPRVGGLHHRYAWYEAA